MNVEVFRAHDNAGWIATRDPPYTELQEGVVPPRVESILQIERVLELDAVGDFVGEKPPAKVVHFLMRLPDYKSTSRKRRALAELFVPGPTKRTKTLGKEVEYFDMQSFPPMADQAKDFKRILVRDAYKTIHADLAFFAHEASWKHRAKHYGDRQSRHRQDSVYLYVIWRLTTDAEVVKSLKSMILVLNYKAKYWRYISDRKEFVKLEQDEVDELSDTPNVLRLIDSRSNDMEDWSSGQSVLFSAPGVDEVKYFRKKPVRIIMPAWSIDEFKMHNELLSKKLQLASDELQRRFDSFGGIARYVFNQESMTGEYEASVSSALESNNAVDIIQTGINGNAVDASGYSHRLFVMVPENTKTYLSRFRLEFSSTTIAADVTKKTEIDAFRKLSKLKLLHQDLSTGALRGFIHEEMGHRWFQLHESITMHLVPLPSTLKTASGRTGRTTRRSNAAKLPHPSGKITIQLAEREVVDFKDLSEVSLTPQSKTMYYRPVSKRFAAVDSIMVLPDGNCFCLQFTLNLNHGLNGNAFNELAAALNVEVAKLPVVWVVSTDLVSEFKQQTRVVETSCNTLWSRLSVISGATRLALDTRLFYLSFVN